MKKFVSSRVAYLVLGLLAGAVFLGASPWAAAAQDAAARLFGFRYSHQVLEKYEISPGLNSLGNFKRPEKTQEIREVFNYPGYYGQVLSITGDSQAATIWFAAPDGAIRNAVIDAPAHRPLILKALPQQKLEHDFVRGSEER